MPSPYQLVAAHPALDLVNTLDNRFVARGPNELLVTYDDLLSFAEQSALVTGRQRKVLGRQSRSSGAAQALRGAHELREAVAVIFYGLLGATRKPTHAAIETLERHVLEAARHRQLVLKRSTAESAAGSRATWTWGDYQSHPELPVWILAQSAASLLTSGAMQHVHMCNSETCLWLFLDSSKNHSRRWCDMKVCGNRIKVRRYQAKL